jgi:hypothetical protein
MMTGSPLRVSPMMIIAADYPKIQLFFKKKTYELVSKKVLSGE